MNYNQVKEIQRNNPLGLFVLPSKINMMKEYLNIYNTLVNIIQKKEDDPSEGIITLI